jgi:SAM-dependent methyltransferase
MQLPKSSYVGRYAEIFDLLYADKPYQEEAAFIHYCIQTYGNGGKYVLELACGTGTHALILEKFGYEITATDYSPDMLAQAHKKAKASQSGVEFRLQNMLDLDSPEQSRDAVICLFDSIGYVATNENLLKILNAVRHQLRPGGVFIFEFWHAGAMLRYFDPVRFLRLQIPTGEIERISETSIDYREQICHVSYTLNEFNIDGTYHTSTETQINRFFLVQEMSLLLQSAHLLPLKWFAGYRNDEHIDQSIWHIVTVAKKDNH